MYPVRWENTGTLFVGSSGCCLWARKAGAASVQNGGIFIYSTQVSVAPHTGVSASPFYQLDRRQHERIGLGRQAPVHARLFFTAAVVYSNILRLQWWRLWRSCGKWVPDMLLEQWLQPSGYCCALLIKIKARNDTILRHTVIIDATSNIIDPFAALRGASPHNICHRVLSRCKMLHAHLFNFRAFWVLATTCSFTSSGVFFARGIRALYCADLSALALLCQSEEKNNGKSRANTAATGAPFSPSP